MTHDPELIAAEYLDEMAEEARAEVEMHLLTCDECWQEVCLARAGRELARAGREPAPAAVQDAVRAAVATSSARPLRSVRPLHSVRLAMLAGPGRARRRGLVAVLAAVVAAAAVVLPRALGPAAGPNPGSRPAVASSGTALAAAVAGFQHDQLPGTSAPPQPAPELSRIGLQLVKSGAGRIDEAAVSVFAYRDGAGHRLSIYQSSRAFAEGAEARHLGDHDDAWTMQAGTVSVLCAKGSHATLLLGSDPQLVRRAGAALNAI